MPDLLTVMRQFMERLMELSSLVHLTAVETMLELDLSLPQ